VWTALVWLRLWTSGWACEHGGDDDDDDDCIWVRDLPVPMHLDLN